MKMYTEKFVESIFGRLKDRAFRQATPKLAGWYFSYWGKKLAAKVHAGLKRKE